MKFLVDASVEFRLVPLLEALGHDVKSIRRDYSPSLPDPEVLAAASDEQRVLLTNDRDFGDLVFRHQRPHSGVIYFRLGPGTATLKMQVLERLLLRHPESYFRQFLIVSPRGVRVRHRPRQ
jgi:predicted nuclease of predicted toxin-antitoxin system